jgi:hypothetical protein
MWEAVADSRWRVINRTYEQREASPSSQRTSPSRMDTSFRSPKRNGRTSMSPPWKGRREASQSRSCSPWRAGSESAGMSPRTLHVTNMTNQSEVATPSSGQSQALAARPYDACSPKLSNSTSLAISLKLSPSEAQGHGASASCRLEGSYGTGRRGSFSGSTHDGSRSQRKNACIRVRCVCSICRHFTFLFLYSLLMGKARPQQVITGHTSLGQAWSI